jgi:hypothetical protein
MCIKTRSKIIHCFEFGIVLGGIMMVVGCDGCDGSASHAEASAEAGVVGFNGCRF